MKIIEPSVENITPDKYDLDSIYKHIEKCGRTCYKSEDKIIEDSYKKFCGNIKNDEHLSVFEHGTVYLKIPTNKYTDECITKYKDNEYSKVVTLAYNSNYTKPKLKDELGVYITTNMRVIIENNWEDDLQYLCEPTEYHEKRYTFKVICGIDISREWNRHRKMSISEQSTRYCNYSKEKFGGELTFIKPSWAIDINNYLEFVREDDNGKYFKEYYYDLSKEIMLAENINVEHMLVSNYSNLLFVAEQTYLTALKLGLKPQEARKVLPLDTATEVIYTAFKSDWKHFLSLRSPKAGATGVHPDMQIIADKIFELLK